MADGFTIYHNPRCTTSRKTLDLLRDNGIEPTIVELKVAYIRDLAGNVIRTIPPSEALAVPRLEPLLPVTIGGANSSKKFYSNGWRVTS